MAMALDNEGLKATMMSISRVNVRKWILASLAALFMAPAAQVALALQPLTDDQLSDVDGAGLTLAFDDFSFEMAPTSYIEVTGAEPGLAAAGAGWERGDLRFYGMSITSGETGAAGREWYDGTCSNTVGMCPLGSGTVASFAPTNNPYVLRVFENPGFDPAGNLLANDNTLGTPDAPAPTNLEFVGPTASDPWRWAFWGQLEVDRNGTQRYLKSQTIIKGKNITTSGQPSILRVFQTQDATPTLGLTYQSAISGDFRFSVRQENVVTESPDVVPDFNDNEGLVFRNVDAFLPLGTLHSQYLTLDDAGNGTGNFVIELTRLPNVPNVYNNFYCGASKGGTCALDADDRILNPNPDTHGYVRWGNQVANPYTATPGTGANQLPTGNSLANGIFFTQDGTPGTTVNLGTARVEGLMIHHMKITTLGVN